MSSDVPLGAGARVYANHPGTVPWHGRSAALYARQEEEVAAMGRRGFRLPR